MRKHPYTVFTLFVMLMTSYTGMAADTLYVWRACQPIVMGREQNIALDIRVTNNSSEARTLNCICLALNGSKTNISQTDLYFSGTTSLLASRTTSSAVGGHQGMFGGGQQLYSDPAYAILKSSVKNPAEIATFQCNATLRKGINCFFVSLKTQRKANLSDTFDIHIKGAQIDGKEVIIVEDGPQIPFRHGISVRNHNDDGVFAYRIPGLVTANDGTLVSVFDIRRSTSIDLQENIQIGVCRSKDGGRTWGKMITAMDMRGYGGLPDSQNGTGDPSILVDPSTGKLYIMALWTHGIGGSTSWGHCKQGMTAEDGAAQVLVVESEDNGRTWSQPRNITSQIKNPSWFILLQGPGRGTAMKDGTLVFPFQYKNEKDMPASTIVYSKDKGYTWTLGTRARENTTEAQVIQLGNGDLMLNMRDNRGGYRAVSTTSDLGKTWTEHSSSRNSLIEPVCMASLIRVAAGDNILGRDILLFSNPNSTSKRNNITIKASLDEGKTWIDTNSLLLDAENGWGYSCLTMIDRETVGILYESSKAHLLFQAVKLTDIVKQQ